VLLTVGTRWESDETAPAAVVCKNTLYSIVNGSVCLLIFSMHLRCEISSGTRSQGVEGDGL
jgi:hypothetical protein